MEVPSRGHNFKLRVGLACRRVQGPSPAPHGPLSTTRSYPRAQNTEPEYQHSGGPCIRTPLKQTKVQEQIGVAYLSGQEAQI